MVPSRKRKEEDHADPGLTVLDRQWKNGTYSKIKKWAERHGEGEWGCGVSLCPFGFQFVYIFVHAYNSAVYLQNHCYNN